MSEMVLDTMALPDFLFNLIGTKKVRVREHGGEIWLAPIKEEVDCTVGLRGMFAGDPNMTVDKFLERKRADKELDL